MTRIGQTSAPQAASRKGRGSFFAVPAAALFLALVRAFPLCAEPGETGGAFLRIVQSPRAVAMGEAGAALPGDLLGALALNPASLALTDHREFAFAYNLWIEDVSVQQAAYAHPLPAKKSVLAASLVRLGMDSIDGYNNSGAYTGGVEAGDLAFSLYYARRLAGPWQDMRLGLFAGAGLKYARETLDEVSAGAQLLDLGALWRSKMGNGVLGLGLSAQSLGSGFKFDSRTDDAPRVIRAAAAYTTITAGDPLSFSAEVRKPVDGDMSFSLGGEYSIRRMVTLRAGYVSGTDMGGGLRLGGGVNIKLVQLDYALSGYGKFGSVHRFGLSYKFGKPVEVTPHISPEQEQARWKTERARRFIRENRYYEAILELNGALDLDPGSLEALELMKKARNLVDTER